MASAFAKSDKPAARVPGGRKGAAGIRRQMAGSVVGSRPKGDARRKALLDATQQLLEAIALEDLTYRAVSERADIPESSAYHFFPDLQSIYRALLDRLGAEFDVAFMRPVTQKQAQSWQSILGVFWDRATDFHKSCPVHAKLTISGKVPLELRAIDRAADDARDEFVMREIDRYFVLPRIENLAEIFHIGAQMGNLVLSLSMLQHGKLTPPMIAYAKVAMTSFVARYIGETLQSRPSGVLVAGHSGLK